MGETCSERFHVLDHSPVGMFVIEADFRVVFWNRRMEDWTGVGREEILDTSLVKRYPLLSQPKYQIRLDAIFQGGPPAVFSAQLHGNLIACRLPDGQTRIQQTTVTAVPVPGKTRFMALFAIEDVTELTHRIRDYRAVRDQALAELNRRKKVEKELIMANERLTLTLEGMDAVIFVADMETSRILYANPYTKAAFRLRGGPVVLPGDGGPRRQANRRSCTLKNEPAQGDEEARVVSWEYLSPLTGRWYAICDRMITWTNGCKAKITIGVDIHDTKIAEKERMRGEKLQGALEMAGAVCHELNQPLQPLQNTHLGLRRTAAHEIRPGRALAGKAGKNLRPDPENGRHHPAPHGHHPVQEQKLWRRRENRRYRRVRG